MCFTHECVKLETQCIKLEFTLWLFTGELFIEQKSFHFIQHHCCSLISSLWVPVSAGRHCKFLSLQGGGISNTTKKEENKIKEKDKMQRL